MNVLNPGNQLTLYGQKTPKVVIYKHESHKLHQAFNVKDGETIVQGMPVALHTDGTIKKYTAASGEVYLGIAVTDTKTPAYAGQRAYPVEVTVAVEGYAICYWAAAAAVTPGFVKPSGTLYNNRYPNCTNTEGTPAAQSQFIALASADAPDGGVADLIPVLCR